MRPTPSRPSNLRAYRVLSLFALAAAGCHHAAPVTQNPTPAKQEELAVHRFPGVEVLRTSTGGTLIRIISGLVGDGEPLYVVDGTPVTVQRGRGLDWLSPDDIARIVLLKDPADIAVYGPRGVNGVILITTKRSR